MEVTLTQDRQIYESGGIALPLSAFLPGLCSWSERLKPQCKSMLLSTQGSLPRGVNSLSTGYYCLTLLI